MNKLIEVKNGWLAMNDEPRAAGFGRTREDAQADLVHILESARNALERYYRMHSPAPPDPEKETP